MKVPRVARRIVATCVAVAALAPAAALAATQQEVAAGVGAGAAWLRTQQNPTTGQITGFGGDYALSALAAAGVHAADVRGPGALDPSAQDYYADLWSAHTTPNSTAILFGAAAGSTCSGCRRRRTWWRCSRRRTTDRRSRGLVRRRCDQSRGLQRTRARPRGRAVGRVGQGQRLPSRSAAHRRRLELRPRRHGRPAGGSERRRHHRRRAGRPVRDGCGSDRP